jgi:tRNA-(ms[2]io[6]A)-hydroxylase
MSTQELLVPIMSFLKCETPQAWIDEAVKKENLPIILIEYLVCELNAKVCKLAFILNYSVNF